MMLWVHFLGREIHLLILCREYANTFFELFGGNVGIIFSTKNQQVQGSGMSVLGRFQPLVSLFSKREHGCFV